MSTYAERSASPSTRRSRRSALRRCKVTTVFPFPLYPGLQAFADSPEVKALEEKYQPRKFDLEESAALMTAAGFTKNGDDLWEKEWCNSPRTQSAASKVSTPTSCHCCEMLRTAGFDAAIDFSNDAYNHMANGDPGLYMFGHGASLKDPMRPSNSSTAAIAQP